MSERLYELDYEGIGRGVVDILRAEALRNRAWDQEEKRRWADLESRGNTIVTTDYDYAPGGINRIIEVRTGKVLFESDDMAMDAAWEGNENWYHEDSISQEQRSEFDPEITYPELGGLGDLIRQYITEHNPEAILRELGFLVDVDDDGGESA